MTKFQIEIENKRSGERKIIAIKAKHSLAAKAEAEAIYPEFRALYAIA